jgi:hypothetical protein
VLDNSAAVRQLVGDKVGNGHGGGQPETARSPEATLAAVLGNLMIKADDTTRGKLKALLEQARQLGVHNDKVS